MNKNERNEAKNERKKITRSVAASDILPDLFEETEEARMLEKQRRSFEEMLTVRNNPWNYDTKGLESVKAAMSMLSTKNGLYSKIPIYCKDKKCPYSESCLLLPYGLAPKGQPCPVETSQIEERHRRYCMEFDLDENSFTDMNLVSEIVSLEIMMERCKALLSKEQVPVIEITTGITESGREIKQPTVSQAYVAYEKMSKKRDSNYQLLAATRRDKATLKNKNAGSDKDPIDALYEIINDPNVDNIEKRPDTYKEK